MREFVHGNQVLVPLPSRPYLPIDSEFSVISVALKVLSSFYSPAARKSGARKEDRRKRGRKREKTNKFAANRPLKTRHANGSRGNFKFYDSKSRRCDILRLPLPAVAAATFTPTLLPLRLLFTRFSVPLSTSRIYPSQCPAKKFSFPEIAPCAASERIPVTFAQLLYLSE